MWRVYVSRDLVLTGMQGDYKLFWRVKGRAGVSKSVNLEVRVLVSTSDVDIDLKSFIDKEVPCVDFYITNGHPELDLELNSGESKEANRCEETTWDWS